MPKTTTRKTTTRKSTEDIVCGYCTEHLGSVHEDAEAHRLLAKHLAASPCATQHDKANPTAKARCPKCGSVARKLYHRLGSDQPMLPVDDAAECPDHGSFLRP